jgi:thiamine biosynthesis protein ThiI
MARRRPALIVHYHEISLKRGNRPLFLRQLLRNLERATADVGPVRVHQRPGRIVLDLEGNERPDVVAARVARVCGVASASLASRVPSSVDAMKTAIAALVEERRFASFRISARRAFKTYPLTSVELNRELGAFVVQQTGARVDLRAPELEIHVEVLPAETFVYADRVPGPGGLPVGTAGTVAALLSGGIDRRASAARCADARARSAPARPGRAAPAPTPSPAPALRRAARIDVA